MHANSEAFEYFTTAMSLGHPDQAAIHEAMGDIAVLAGRYRLALDELEATAALVAGSDLARVEHKLGRLYYRRGDWEAAESYLRAALTQSDRGVRHVEVLADLATTAHRLSNAEAARELAAQALAAAEGLGDRRAASRAANVSGLLARAADDLEGAKELLEHGRALAVAVGDQEMVIATLNNLAQTRGATGDHGGAIDLLERALDACRRIGDRHREAALLSNLGDAQFAAGLEAEAASSVRQSAVIMTEIGSENEALLPEVWKLTEW